jgi:hypothetical protein
MDHNINNSNSKELVRALHHTEIPNDPRVTITDSTLRSSQVPDLDLQ